MTTINSYSKDKHGIYLSANPDFVAFTQVEHVDNLLGKNDLDMPWVCSAGQIMKNDAQVIASKKSHVFIEEAVIKGKKHFRRCFKSPLLGTGGKIIGIVGMSTSLDPTLLVPLTPQQSACLKELAQGCSIKKIGKNLGLSPRTVEHYLNTIKNKLGCHTRSELIVQAIMRGIIVG